MVNSRVRLDVRAAFCRAAVSCFLFVEILFVLRTLRVPGPRHRVRFLLLTSPIALLSAVAMAGMLTVAAVILVELIVRPLVSRWHSPRTDLDAGQFHLASNEWVIESTSARRSMGWRWPPGSLIRTNLRLWFVPEAHDVDVWSLPLGTLAGIRLEPAPRVAWGTIRNWPERLSVRGAGEAEPVVFAVSDPRSVLGWFGPPRSAVAPSSSF